jgi:glycosyltransferase involved in cell wall biosynthesis
MRDTPYNMPELSVIVPTFNRSARLQRCLAALGKQSLDPGSFEVIVVVDGATDSTLSMLKGLAPVFSMRTIWQENAGQAVALNRGIAEARGRFCLFIDDDIVVTPACLAEHLRAQQAHGQLVAIGQLEMAVPENASWYTRAFAEGWRRHYDTLNQGIEPITWEDCYSGNMSAPCKLLRSCGGFDTTLARGFDVELALRLERAGCTLKYLPAAAGYQDERKGFRELSRDIEEAGAADFRLFASGQGVRPGALDSFHRGHPLKVLLRRALLALRVPPGLLAPIGRLLPSSRQRYVLHSLIQNYCYWRGVRRAARGTRLWANIRRGSTGPIGMIQG